MDVSSRSPEISLWSLHRIMIKTKTPEFCEEGHLVDIRKIKENDQTGLSSREGDSN